MSKSLASTSNKELAFFQKIKIFFILNPWVIKNIPYLCTPKKTSKSNYFSQDVCNC